MTRLPRPLLTLVVAAAVSAARADDTAVLLAPVEVVDSRLPLGARSGAQYLGGVARDQIDRRQPATVADLLRGVPGVDVTQQGGAGGLSFVSIRGGDPNFTLFLIDGVKVNDPTNARGGGFDLYALDPALVERIEVYAGSLSSVQGSAALGGVVSITTRRAAARRAAGVTVGAGSDGRRRASARAGGVLGAGGAWSIDAAYDDGGRAVPGDRLHRRSLSARAQRAFGDTLAVATQLLVIDGDSASFPEDSGGPRLAAIRRSERRAFQRWLASIDVEQALSETWSMRATASLTSTSEQVRNPGIAPGALAGVPAFDSDRSYRRTDIDLALTGEVTGRLALTVGAAFSRERGGSSDVIDVGAPLRTDFRRERDTFAVFAESSFEPIPALRLVAGLRHDRPESAASETVARLAASLRLSATQTMVRASWSEGFKLPSLFALGNPLVGNAELGPERSEQLELGIDQALLDGRARLAVTLFHARYRGLIDFDPVAFTNINRGQVRAKGFETVLEHQPFEALRVTGTLTYDDVDPVAPSIPLRRRPLWKGRVAADWTARSDLSARLDAVWSDGFIDSSVPTGFASLPARWRVDASARFASRDGAALTLGVRNLLGHAFEEAIGFPDPGRQLYVSLELAL